jgi:hypothetical protein
MIPTVRRFAFGMSAAVNAMAERWRPSRKCASRGAIHRYSARRPFEAFALLTPSRQRDIARRPSGISFSHGVGRLQRFGEDPVNVRCFKAVVETGLMSEAMPRGSGRQETGSNASPDRSLFAHNAPACLQRFNLPVDRATVSPRTISISRSVEMSGSAAW